MRFISSYAFPFFFLVNLFASEIFGCYLSINEITVSSGMLQKLFIVISFISYLILIRDLIKGYNLRGYIRVITILLVILVFMSVTQLFYYSIPPTYIAAILYFGSISVASSISGAHVASYPLTFTKIDKLFPAFIVPIGMIISTIGYASALKNGLVKTDSGLDYQNVSYYCAEFVAYGAYYILFSTAKGFTSYKFFKWPVIITCFICALMCFMSGGRGGVVLLAVFAIVLLFELKYTHRIKFGHIIRLICGIIVVFALIANYLDLWNTDGFNRVSTRIGTDSIRSSLHAQSWQIFLDSYGLGCGLGSIWMNLGIYSHNIFYDLFAESGIFGFVIVTIGIIKVLVSLFKWSRINIGCLLLLLIFLKGFVLTLFSGYWLNTYQIWFGVGFVFAIYSPQILISSKSSCLVKRKSV